MTDGGHEELSQALVYRVDNNPQKYFAPFKHKLAYEEEVEKARHILV